MKNVVVCYKWIADVQDIRINSDLSVDKSKAKYLISDFDKNAIEAGVQAAKALAGKALGLTFGTLLAKTSLKDALARGLNGAYWINTDAATKADGKVTASALASMVKKIEDVALIICAEGASDTYARQTGPRIGAILDLPVITSIISMSIEGNTLTAVRKMEDCLETVIVQMPTVVSVLPEINGAPIPGLKAVMSAGSKPITEYKAEDLEIDFSPKSEVIEFKGYAMNRKNIILKGDSKEEVIHALIASFRKEGIL
jgi:electron transfer flavoprotein beta subunit